MKPKVGVVTITNGSNYGNKLQHYAVLRILEKLGYQAETVRDTTVHGFAEAVKSTTLLQKLAPQYIEQVISSRMQYKYHKKNQSDGFIRCIQREKKRHFEFEASQKKRQERFDAFSEKYLSYSSLSINATTRPDEKLVSEYHAFVCGSDQVWNPNYRDVSPVRFLQFAPAEKRIALSPSFGVSEIPETRRNIYAKMLSEFPALSVREKSGQKIIKDLTGRDVPVLIDPTLMLTAEEWDTIAQKPEGDFSKPFLLTYFLGNKIKAYEKWINQYAKENDLRIINLAEISEAESYCYDPAEFLWLFKNAAFICTDSFHGTVFSILYHKRFFTFARSESGFDKDSRVATLLEKLQLQECIFTGKTYQEPDYDRAEHLLDAEREKFIQYLQKALADVKPVEHPHYVTVAELNAKDRSNCTGCGACFAICPTNAIRMERNAEGFSCPYVDAEICIRCGKCVAICEETSTVAADDEPTAFACQNKNEVQRICSSSGGVFALLAEYVLKQGGIVYGAAFDGEYQLSHCGAESMDGVPAFMGSKYLQSETAWCFAEVHRHLEAGRKVLFSGTPCQVGGLKAFLGKNYDNLITVDIICHGVPSQYALDAYLADHDKLGTLKTVSFRNKDNGWSKFSMKIEGDGKTYRKDLQHDSYLVAFLRNANLRESCYNCRFKTAQRAADLTLADLWGAASLCPEWNDDKGVSLVVAHSEVGKDILKKIASVMNTKEVSLENALKNNSAALHSVLRPVARGDFYVRMKTSGFEKTVHEFYPMTLERRIGFLKEKVYPIYAKLRRRE